MHSKKFHSPVNDYVAAAKALGGAPEKPASGKLMLRNAPEVHAAAVRAAAKSGTSLNNRAEGALGAAARRKGTTSRALPGGT